MMSSFCEEDEEGREKVPRFLPDANRQGARAAKMPD
jgi:hypothetical protein